MLPPAAELPSLTAEAKADALGLLFEPCATLVALAQPVLDAARPGTTWPQLIEQIRARLLQLAPADARTAQIVAAHPRLGAKKVESAQSRAEQASLQQRPRAAAGAGAGAEATAEAEAEAEAAELARRNAEYEATFPGLRYVVFVAGRPRSEILRDMQRRIAENNYEKEVRRAFDAMCDIALDRCAKLLGR